MSLKDIFSKKKKVEKKSTKIGQKNDNVTWDDDDFFKNEMQTTSNNIDQEKSINLSTDASLDEDAFLSRFSNIENEENYESRLENISSIDGDLDSLSFSLDDKISDKINLKEKDIDLISSETIEATNDLNYLENVLNDFKENKEDRIKESTFDIDSFNVDLLEESQKEKIEEFDSEIFNKNKKSLESFDIESFNVDSIKEESNNLDVNTTDKDTDFSRGLDALTKSGLDAITRGGLDTPTRSNLDIPSMSSWNSGENNSKSSQENFKNKTIFGSLSLKAQYLLFFTTLIGSAAGIGTSIHFKNVATEKESIAAKLTSELWTANQKFGHSFKNAVMGNSGEYDVMIKDWEQILKIRKSLIASVESLNNEVINKNITEIENDFKTVGANVSFMKSQESLFRNGNDINENINKNISTLISLVEKIGSIDVQLGVTVTELAQIYELKGYLENIRSSTTNILLSESIRPESASILTLNREIFKNDLAELSVGNQEKNIKKLNVVSQPIYNNILKNWLILTNDLDKILTNIDNYNKSKSLGKNNQEIITEIHVELKDLLNQYNGSTHSNSFLVKNLLIISILLLLLSIGALFYVYNFEKEKNSQNSLNESNKNKNDIMKLLNEMMPLQDGDLTQKTSIEDGSITENISKSVNETIESLSSVVKRIKETSSNMELKTSEVNDISIEMLMSNETQTKSIVETGDSVIKISKAIGDIAEKTKLGLITAKNSAKASTLGSKNVNESISSMNVINKNMEETVHLMKKVSDSSKQISEVIGLLSDITEETNILALNATVQAAKAGEAGKGFKIVADSIQELADNAAEATRRVGALIATVQTDIQSVSLSVEKTTSEVLHGVELSENAGKSLSEINVISNELAEIVQTISKDAIVNAEAAKQISNNMEKILNVTEKTKISTQKTTSSIGEIAQMSNELGDSVQSFVVR